MFARFYAFVLPLNVAFLFVTIVIIAYNDDIVAVLLIKFYVSNLMNFSQDGDF